MTAMTTGNPSRADANRRRILDVALAELLRDPDVSMDQIARAAASYGGRCTATSRAGRR